MDFEELKICYITWLAIVLVIGMAFFTSSLCKEHKETKESLDRIEKHLGIEQIEEE